MQEFQEILKAKRDYYGNTEAAIHFAAEEYARQYLKEALLEGWHLTEEDKAAIIAKWTQPQLEKQPA